MTSRSGWSSSCQVSFAVRVRRQDISPSMKIVRGATGRMNVKKRWIGESQYQARVTTKVQKKTKGEHRQVQRSRDVTSNMLQGIELAYGANGINRTITCMNESAVSIALFRIPAASSSPKW